VRRRRLGSLEGLAVGLELGTAVFEGFGDSGL
jgi:hypothetical protein